MWYNGLITTEVVTKISIVNDQLEPTAVRDIVDIDIVQCNLVNSVEKCFYNNVFGHLGDGHRHPHQPQIGKLANKRDATPAVASTVGAYNLRTTGGASHNDFQQHFSEAVNTNRSSTFTSTSTSKRRTSTSSAASFSTTVSEWKSQPTTETTWRTTSSTTCPSGVQTFSVGDWLRIVQQRSSTTRSTRKSGSKLTFEFSSSSTSKSLRPSTTHLVISLFTPSSSEGGYNDKMDDNNDKTHKVAIRQWLISSVRAVYRRHRRQESYNKFMTTNSSTKSSVTKNYSSSSSRRSSLQQSSLQQGTLQQEELEEFISNKLIDFQAVHQHRAHRRAIFSSTPSTTRVQQQVVQRIHWEQIQHWVRDIANN